MGSGTILIAGFQQMGIHLKAGPIGVGSLPKAVVGTEVGDFDAVQDR